MPKNMKNNLSNIWILLFVLGIGYWIIANTFLSIDDSKTKVCTNETIQSINFVDGKYIAKTYEGSVFEIDNIKYRTGDSYSKCEYVNKSTLHNTAGNERVNSVAPSSNTNNWNW